MIQKIIITGSGGMVGKNLTDALNTLKNYKVFPTYYDITIPRNDTESINNIINTYTFLPRNILRHTRAHSILWPVNY